jgi:predicted TPR repeat methyltransferase
MIAHQAGQAEAASELLQRALAAKPDYAEAHNNLGIILLSMGRPDDSVSAFTRATTLKPDFAEARNNLGAALFGLGRFEESVSCYRQAVAIKPDYPEARKNLGDALAKAGQPEEAIACYRAVIGANPGYAEAWRNLGGVFYEQGRRDEALQCYRQVIQIDPRDPVASHLVAALSGTHVDHAPREYVESVFDGYADNFDQHLAQGLKYDIPEKMVALLREFSPAAVETWRVLDLGCGTGMIGAAFACRLRQLTGVDLSARMLEGAKAKGVYSRLEKADVLEFMRREAAASYDVITAADVFIYVGNVDAVAAEARRLLGDGGYFSFSIEALEVTEVSSENMARGPGYALMPAGRFAHSPGYVGALAEACGFRVLQMRPTQIRIDKGVPVKGWLALWQKDVTQP